MIDRIKLFNISSGQERVTKKKEVMKCLISKLRHGLAIQIKIKKLETT